METTKAAWKARIEQAQEEARAIVKTGICPNCGTKLVRNNSIAGWWQCGAYACEAMRKQEFADLPKCNFQCFTV